MNKYFLLSIIIGVFITFNFNFSQETIEKNGNSPKQLYNSALGREFWIAIPPNEADGQPCGNTNDISIDLYVTSAFNTEVTVEIPGLGYSLKKKVEAYKVTQFATWSGETSFIWEIRESEKILDMGIHVFSKQPIAVYVLNHRLLTSDGYLALPVTSWGMDYYHLSYYDFYENNYGGEKRGGGFIITCSEDNTKVTISLDGVGLNLAKTLGGQTAPKTYSVNLNRGNVYMVRGDGTTTGVFDLSGTRITSNKPVGLISFHMRTLIPSYDLYNGRNMLTEMMPPVNSWGKKYVTVEFARKDHGDFFRVICSEAKTKVKIKWFDKSTGEQIGNLGPIELQNPGDFYEYLETFVPQFTTNTLSSIKGTSIFEADKPILVMQYSYSTDWDNSPDFDPFMILVPPIEQFVSNSIFLTPEKESEFLANWFNIIAIGDSTDKSSAKLKSVMIDSNEIYKLNPDFLTNRIPTTNLYWVKLPVSTGAHRVTSNTKFSAYVYGFSSADGYGWPASGVSSNLDICDTLPPVIKRTGDCFSYNFNVSELRNGNINDKPRQVDQGISSIELLKESYNFRLTGIIPDPFDFNYLPLEAMFSLNVINQNADARAIISVSDLYGNSVYDTLSYYSDILAMNPDSLYFGNIKVGQTKTLQTVIKNNDDTTITIKEISLKNNNLYKIISPQVPPEIKLNKNQSIIIKISYTPVSESDSNNFNDLDYLQIKTNCRSFAWMISGRGVQPKILVEDWDAGAIKSGNKICKDIQTGSGLKISNTGTDLLTITNIKNISAPFELSASYSPQLPFSIQPGEDIRLISPCYFPMDSGRHSINVIFESNAAAGDSISNWHGRSDTLYSYVDEMDDNQKPLKLFDVEPNPVTRSDVTVKYSLAFDGLTRLELVNSKGELAGMLINGEVAKGTHELVIPTTELSSGVYMLRLSSGQFTETKQLVITK